MDITFKEFIETGFKEKKCQIYLIYKGPSKVLFAFDSWNKLLHKESAPNPIAKTIAYWNDFTVFSFIFSKCFYNRIKVLFNKQNKKVNNGIAFFSTTSSFVKNSAQVKLQVFPGASAENQSNFLSVKPFDKNETEIV
jgi:hypothetical protein